jgi:proteasome lid subunit RPN8/RPN11
MINRLDLEKHYADAMADHARGEAPNECCGILAGVNSQVIKLFRITNSEHSPDRYSMDPRELIAAYQEIQQNRWELLGIYHSHTHTEAYPSSTDVKSAVLSQPLYFIISLNDPSRAVLRVFRIIDGTIIEIQLQIAET